MRSSVRTRACLCHTRPDTHLQSPACHLNSSGQLGLALRADEPRFSPTGLAFDISDLMAIIAWADRNDVRMVVRLDHGVDDEEYEEVIAFQTKRNVCFLLLWRDENTVFAQPLPGRRMRFSSVTEALDRLHVTQHPAALH